MTPTQETISSSGRMLRRSLSNQHDSAMSFWMSRPTIMFLALDLVMVIGVACILHFELRPSVDTSTTTAESRPVQLVSASTPPLTDSSPPQETLVSRHE